MYRLLIVDDEPTLRKGMLSCVNWKKYEIGTIKEAHNGLEALEKALSFNPHIILTDIRMPTMDGIELSHNIREKMPDCKIVIMSGYDEFAYAKSLMRMGVTEYLLKPIDEKELMLVISRLISEIKEDEAKKSNQHAASLILNENLPQLKFNFMSKILNGGFSDIEEMVRYATALNLHIPDDCRFMAIIISAESQNSFLTKDETQQSEPIISEISNLTEELLNKTTAGFLCRDNSSNLVGIIYFNSPHSPDTESLSRDIHYFLKEYLGITVCVSIGSTAQSISDINVSYKKALSELDEKLHKGKRNFVQIALRYMDEHYGTDIGLSDIAEIAFVTPNYFSRIFKEEMGMSFIDYLNQLRVEKAKQLLLHTNLKTYEIAEKVGYKDYKYFSSMLKKFTGFSPREFRRS